MCLRWPKNLLRRFRLWHPPCWFALNLTTLLLRSHVHHFCASLFFQSYDCIVGLVNQDYFHIEGRNIWDVDCCIKTGASNYFHFQTTYFLFFFPFRERRISSALVKIYNCIVLYCIYTFRTDIFIQNYSFSGLFFKNYTYSNKLMNKKSAVLQQLRRSAFRLG